MKIAILSDGPNINSGYGIVARNLGIGLKELGYDVKYVSFQHAGNPVKYMDFEIYEGSNTAGITRSLEDADAVIHIRDAFYYSNKWFATAYQVKNLTKKKVYLYTPVQSDNLPNEFLQACMYDADFCVAMTEWAKNVLIFEGVPVDRLFSVKPGMMASEPDGSVSFSSPTVGSVGVVDQYRKDFPALIAGFSEFRKTNREWNLYIHAPSMLGASDLIHFARRFGVKPMYPSGISRTWGWSDAEMASMYSSLKIYASTSIAEGYNMPLVEAAAYTGVIVATDMPNHREALSGFDGVVWIPAKKIYPTAWSFEWVVDPIDVAHALDRAKDMKPKKKVLTSYRDMAKGFDQVLNSTM